MPNRVIRDAVLDSARYHSVDKLCRLAFLELLLKADDYGLVPLSDLYLQRHCTAFAKLKPAANDAVLRALEQADLIRTYTSGGARFAFMPRFANNPRASKPKWPLPPADFSFKEINDLVEKVRSRRKQLHADASHVHADAPETETETETETEKKGRSVSAGKGFAGAPPTPPAKTGTRLSKEWQLPLAWGQWAQTAYPHWPVDTVREIATRFRDHWTAKTGRDSTKLDWEATWRNWCKSDITQRQFPPPAGSNGKGHETPYQRGKRERVSELTGGLAARVAPPAASVALTLDIEPAKTLAGQELEWRDER